LHERDRRDNSLDASLLRQRVHHTLEVCVCRIPFGERVINDLTADGLAAAAGRAAAGPAATAAAAATVATAAGGPCSQALCNPMAASNAEGMQRRMTLILSGKYNPGVRHRSHTAS